MRLIDLTTSDIESPDAWRRYSLPLGAYEVGFRTLLDELDITAAEDAVVLIQDGGVVGQYGLARLYREGEPGETWAVEAGLLIERLKRVTDEELARAGRDLSEPGFVAQADRVVRRRLAHFEGAQLRDVLALLPRLEQLGDAWDRPADAERT